MTVSAYEHFSPVGDILIPFCIRQDLLKQVGMGDQRVDDLWVTWADDAVFSYVGRPGNPSTKF